MPEEVKPSAKEPEVTAENGTGNNSPNKGSHNKGKNAVAKVTLLDGIVKDFVIDVSIKTHIKSIILQKQELIFFSVSFREKQKVKNSWTKYVRV